MRLRHPPRSLAVSTICFVMTWSVAGLSQDAAPTSPGSTASPTASRLIDTMKLSYGVEDVLKLARARVSDETIIAFVGSSGRIYNLSADEILYLRSQGVADRVLTAMLQQRNKLAEPIAWPTLPSRASAESKQVQPVPTPPAQAAAVRPAPASVAPPPVYLLRNPPPVYPYYDYYPHYRSPASAFSLSFGFGNGYYRGGFGYTWAPYR